MRELKFRAWDKEENRWVGVPVVAGKLSGDDPWFIWPTGEFGIEHRGYADVSDEQDRYIIQQFTGLHDKNGKEIYEGDILDVVVLGGIERYEVKWARSGFFITDGWGPWCPTEEQITLLGNIYENPELLKAVT